MVGTWSIGAIWLTYEVRCLCAALTSSIVYELSLASLILSLNPPVAIKELAKQLK